MNSREYTGFEIAVIGMAAKFPGAESINQFWDNLINGEESIAFFTDNQLIEAGVPKADIDNPKYIKAGGVINDIENFDNNFFGYTPFEANLMDPQMRLFHEYAWKALEDAGYAKDNSDRNIGIFGGASPNDYWRFLGVISNTRKSVGEWAASQLNSKDYLCQRVAYKLNLKGPSLSVQTACSTSLAAVHIASQSLLNYECNIALAGGVCIGFPATPDPGDTFLLLAQEKGYNYQEGMILSADGHCKTFDAEATGTVPGNGVGMVVLKRLSDAIKDNDNIYAIITGSAINNDGSQKVGFTAPSIDGQANVIKSALNISEIEPETITYIETHGTGTSLGDPIEIEALKTAFASKKRRYCAIGSVKTNIGHLDTAAGIAGFIKTVLALKNKQIPPSLHFKTPNPKIDFENSPFYVNTAAQRWENSECPLRAGVSSFGIGGTNVHVILEEAPEKSEITKGREWEILTFSAKTENSLNRNSEKIIDFFKKNKNINFADAAYTLKVGRETFAHRQFMICSDINEAINRHQNSDFQIFEAKEEKRIVFLFSGQGSQYVNMGKKIYEGEPIFRKELDSCFQIAKQLVNIDFQAIVFPDEKFTETAREQINQTQYTQPILFMFEYALARFLMHIGIRPYAMMGHSIGEYVAACLAGVFTLKDAIELVIIRAKLMQSVPEGSMLSAVLSETEAQKYISDDIEIAAINSPNNVVFSGTIGAIDSLIEKFDNQEIINKKLHTSHAFHSKMMDSILNMYEGKVSQMSLYSPNIPFISNTSGEWIKNDEAKSPTYWTKQLRHAVLFSKGILNFKSSGNALFLEIGPGNSLTNLTNQHFSGSERNRTFNLIKHPHEQVDESYYFLNKIGQLWLNGVNIDWKSYYEDENRNKISLPTYEFEQKRCWDIFDLVKEYMSSGPKLIKNQNIADWFYSPVWKRDDLFNTSNPLIEEKKWLIFSDRLGYGKNIADYLVNNNQSVITVDIGGDGFEKKKENNYFIDPSKKEHFNNLFNELNKNSWAPSKIIHLWNLTSDKIVVDNENIDDELDLSFFSILFIAKEIEKQNFAEKITFFTISNHIQEVTGEEIINPFKAASLGLIKVIPQELPNIDCISIDVKLPENNLNEQRLAAHLINELNIEHQNKAIAYRSNYRWSQSYAYYKMPDKENIPLNLTMNGVYIVTGGLGNLGFVVAEYLARMVKAKIILTTRTDFPDKKDWDKWLNGHTPDDVTSQKIKKLINIGNFGGEIIVKTVDVADELQMENLIADAEVLFKKINGVLHLAGLTSGRSIAFISKLKKEDCFEQFNSKIKGTIVLSKVLKNKDLDFCLLFSSLSSLLGGLGFAAYASANTFMDCFVYQLNRFSSTRWLSVNWDGWKFTDNKNELSEQKQHELIINEDEGVKALSYIFSVDQTNQLIVSTGDITLRINKWINLNTVKEEKQNILSLKISNSRPNLTTNYTAPSDETEKLLVNICGKVLGYNQIGVNDDFYELGGDSLKAISISSAIQKEFKINFPLSEFLTRTTIKQISEFIELVKNKDDHLGIDELNVNNQLELIQKSKDRLLKKKRSIN